MQMPERTPIANRDITTTTSRVRFSIAPPPPVSAGLAMAGCCGAEICVSTPLGQVCHCAGVEGPFC
jgi:hypothetical protein